MASTVVFVGSVVLSGIILLILMTGLPFKLWQDQKKKENDTGKPRIKYVTDNGMLHAAVREVYITLLTLQEDGYDHGSEVDAFLHDLMTQTLTMANDDDFVQWRKEYQDYNIWGDESWIVKERSRGEA